MNYNVRAQGVLQQKLFSMTQGLNLTTWQPDNQTTLLVPSACLTFRHFFISTMPDTPLPPTNKARTNVLL